jgi:hypothetical protein
MPYLAGRPKKPSPPFRGEREGPAPQAWEGEVGAGQRSGIPHLTQPSPPPRAERGYLRHFVGDRARPAGHARGLKAHRPSPAKTIS